MLLNWLYNNIQWDSYSILASYGKCPIAGDVDDLNLILQHYLTRSRGLRIGYTGTWNPHTPSLHHQATTALSNDSMNGCRSLRVYDVKLTISTFDSCSSSSSIKESIAFIHMSQWCSSRFISGVEWYNWCISLPQYFSKRMYRLVGIFFVFITTRFYSIIFIVTFLIWIQYQVHPTTQSITDF